MCVYDLFQFCAGALHTVPEAASYPDVSLSLSLSLSMKICAKRKVGRRKRAVAYHFSPSHGPLRFIKETAGRNCYQSISLYFFKVNSSRLSFTSSLYKFLFVVLAFNVILYILSVSELA